MDFDEGEITILKEMPLFGKIDMDNINRMIEAAKSIKSHLKPGKIWEKRIPPAGELVIVGALLFDDTAISSVEFNPADGYILPRGYHPHVFSLSISYEEINGYFDKIVSELEVGRGAEYREPESSWEFPLIYRGIVVAHIKLYYDGKYVLPDYVINQEMQMYK